MLTVLVVELAGKCWQQLASFWKRIPLQTRVYKAGALRRYVKTADSTRCGLRGVWAKRSKLIYRARRSKELLSSPPRGEKQRLWKHEALGSKESDLNKGHL